MQKGWCAEQEVSQSSALISRNRDQLDHGDVIQNTKDEGYELLTTAAGCRMEFTSQLSMLKKWWLNKDKKWMCLLIIIKLISKKFCIAVFPLHFPLISFQMFWLTCMLFCHAFCSCNNELHRCNRGILSLLLDQTLFHVSNYFSEQGCVIKQLRCRPCAINISLHYQLCGFVIAVCFFICKTNLGQLLYYLAVLCPRTCH